MLILRLLQLTYPAGALQYCVSRLDQKSKAVCFTNAHQPVNQLRSRKNKARLPREKCHADYWRRIPMHGIRARSGLDRTDTQSYIAGSVRYRIALLDYFRGRGTQQFDNEHPIAFPSGSAQPAESRFPRPRFRCSSRISAPQSLGNAARRRWSQADCPQAIEILGTVYNCRTHDAQATR